MVCSRQTFDRSSLVTEAPWVGGGGSMTPRKESAGPVTRETGEDRNPRRVCRSTDFFETVRGKASDQGRSAPEYWARSSIFSHAAYFRTRRLWLGKKFVKLPLDLTRASSSSWL